jgi:predicted phosphoribosyltransferase
MIFRNRQEAGQRLAAHLGKYANRQDAIVLGVPRGGVPIAFEVARALNLPLNVFVLRKLGVPGHEEFAFGAIGSGGVRVLDREVVEALGLSILMIEAVTQVERAELARREQIYRGGRPPRDVRGQTVILVDDGIATGASVTAGVRTLRQMQPAAIVIAAPVVPLAAVNRLRREVDDVVCAEIPETFFGVGQFYDDFSQVSDAEVNELLKTSSRQRTWRPWLATPRFKSSAILRECGELPSEGWRGSFSGSDSELLEIHTVVLQDGDSSNSNTVETPCDARR